MSEPLISELFASTPPYSREDRAKIIAKFREDREKFIANGQKKPKAEKTGKTTAPDLDLDLGDL